MQRRVGADDRDTLDAYFISVRDIEQRLAANEGWAQKPKPQVNVPPPKEVTNANDLIARQNAMHDISYLALQTDSSRFITLHTNRRGEVLPIKGVDEGDHSLSHHGLAAEKIEQLARIEAVQVASWGALVRKLKATREGDGTLLDRTMVLLTSNLGNASSHDNKNLPVLFAGGGFKHGQHLKWPGSTKPASDLYLTILQQLGCPEKSFKESTGPISELL